MIHVIATIEVHDGKRDAFLAEFRKLMPKVHAETGCIEYGPAVDVETGLEMQDKLRSSTVVIMEKWTDVPALKVHLAQPHMGEYRQAVKDFVRGVRLQVLQPAA